MSKYGMNLRYYPRDIISNEETIVIEVTEWMARTPRHQHENLQISVSIVGDDDIDPNDPDWIIMVLTEALGAVEARKAERDGGFISGANG
ncbi:MAG: hypothetical protein KGJ86_11370, partial [Chloroflexota bacterium]|nr:hypothetical protein [Chloroflexota bacterium]